MHIENLALLFEGSFTPPTVCIIIGGIFLAVALVGGGLKAKDVEIPAMSLWARGVSGLCGAVLLLYGLKVSSPSLADKSATPSSANSAASPVPQTVPKSGADNPQISAPPDAATNRKNRTVATTDSSTKTQRAERTVEVQARTPEPEGRVAAGPLGTIIDLCEKPAPNPYNIKNCGRWTWNGHEYTGLWDDWTSNGQKMGLPTTTAVEITSHANENITLHRVDATGMMANYQVTRSDAISAHGSVAWFTPQGVQFASGTWDGKLTP